MSPYIVVDRQTGGKVGGPYQNRRRAKNAADKKDLIYGAIRYAVKEVDANGNRVASII